MQNQIDEVLLQHKADLALGERSAILRPVKCVLVSHCMF